MIRFQDQGDAINRFQIAKQSKPESPKPVPVLPRQNQVAMPTTAAGDSVHFSSLYRSKAPSPLQRIVNDSLVSAAGSGNLSAVGSLLAQRVDINHSNLYQGKTALMQAAENGKTEVLKLLIRKNANLEKVDYDGRTALMLAARSNSLESMKILLDAGAKLYAKDRQGMNALLVAVNCSRTEAVKYLLDQRKSSIETTDLLGRTPLQLAAERGNTELVKELIARKANLENGNFEGVNPLMIAAREGRLPIVKALIEAGANVNARNRFGVTPIMLAARDGNQEVFNLLLEKKADIHPISNDHETALSLAVGGNHLPVVRTLMQHGAALDTANNTGSTPLMEAARLGYGDMVKTLLQKPGHVDINHRDGTGFTALGYAADRGAREGIIEDLLQVPDIDIEVRDVAGNTPLLLAARRGATKSARILLDHGADVNALNRRNSSALHMACNQGQTALAKLLIERGANPEVANIDGTTPLLLATQGAHSKIIDALLQPHRPSQRPFTHSYQQFDDYLDTACKHPDLDRGKPFHAMLPHLAKFEQFRMVDPLFMAQEGKPLAAMKWEAQAEMDAIIDSSNTVKGETDPDLLKAHRKYRDDRWKSLEFMARHQVDLQPAVLQMALVKRALMERKQAILEKIKAEQALEQLKLADSMDLDCN